MSRNWPYTMPYIPAPQPDDDEGFGSDGWTYELSCMEREATELRWMLEEDHLADVAIWSAEDTAAATFSDLVWPEVPAVSVTTQTPDDDIPF